VGYNYATVFDGFLANRNGKCYISGDRLANMEEMNDYTRKILRRVGIGWVIVGVLFIPAGLLLQDRDMGITAVACFVAASACYRLARM
jgi:hypothetical protein